AREPAAPSRCRRRDQTERVKRSRRGRTRRRRLLGVASLALLSLLAGAAWAGKRYLTHSDRFRLRGVVFTKTAHAQEAELRRAVERYRGRNLFRLDLARLERDLEECRWVKSACVKRLLPDRILCAIEERTPQGLALLKGRVWLVDGEGTPIDLYGEATRQYSFPIFKGLDDADAVRGRRQAALGVAFLQFCRATHP